MTLQPQVLILTEATAATGLGHLSRCQALKAAFEQAGCPVTVWLNSDGDVRAQVGEVGYQHGDWRQRLDLLTAAEAYPIVVVDSYLASDELLLALAERVQVPVFLDDTVRMVYPRGVVVNGAPGAENLPYAPNESCYFCLGPAYAHLRPPFLAPKNYALRAQVTRLLVSLGATPPIPVLNGLLEGLHTRMPHQNLVAVVPTGYAYPDKLPGGLQLRNGLSAEGMFQTMQETDLAVAAGGQTLLELVRVGVPTVAWAFAPNQRPNVTGLSDRGAVYALPESATLQQVVDAAFLLSNSFNQRQLLHASCEAVFSDYNAQRLPELVLRLVQYPQWQPN